jgi:hypothetical protein
MQMDRDHPEYRRTVDLDEEDAEFLEDDDPAVMPRDDRNFA